MSSKGTLLYTSKDHWYEDWSTLSRGSTPVDQVPNVHIFIRDEDIVDTKHCDDGSNIYHWFEIDGGSELAQALSRMRDLPDK